MNVTIHTHQPLTDEQRAQLTKAVNAEIAGDYETRFAIQCELREKDGILIAALFYTDVYVSFQEKGEAE